ncbi:TetR/AcrR family transcriptional regulator [Glycomyces halotolerans]
MTSTASDAAKPHLLELLWRRAPTAASRGPKQGLTIDAVVEAAIALADDEGLEAVTMRRLAQSLGVAPMTLYTYVPGKSELIALMVDALYARMPRAEAAGDWRERVAGLARDNYALLRAHPWAAAASQSRPPLGPGQCAKYEHELRALDGIGLDDVEMDDALAFVLGFVRAAAAAAAQSDEEREATAMSHRQWWEANRELLEQVLDAERYPTAVRVGQAAGEAHEAAYSPRHAFEFGLERVLDGLAALIER